MRGRQLHWYSVRLALWHPSINPAGITRVLGFQPRHAAEAGQPRRTPKGNPLGGVHRESYWSAGLFGRGECVSTDDHVKDILTEYLDVLESHAGFIRRLRDEGGRARLWVNSFSARNYTFEFSPELLGRCAALRLSLVVDVYPVAQNVG